MIVLLLLFVLVIVIGVNFFQTSGAAEIVQNKKQLRPEQIQLVNRDFESFVNKRKLKGRLIYIGGAHLSGKTHLAKMIAKKFGYTHINGCNKRPQEVRREIKIDDSVPPNAKPAEKASIAKKIANERESRKYVICGDFSDEDLGKLFKGKGHNRNFIYLFVQPQEDSALAWKKCTGNEKSEYDNVLAETKALLKANKKYRMYLVKNDFR